MHIELDVSSEEPTYSKTIFGVSSKEEDFVTANRKLLIENLSYILGKPSQSDDRYSRRDHYDDRPHNGHKEVVDYLLFLLITLSQID